MRQIIFVNSRRAETLISLSCMTIAVSCNENHRELKSTIHPA